MDFTAHGILESLSELGLRSLTRAKFCKTYCGNWAEAVFSNLILSQSSLTSKWVKCYFQSPCSKTALDDCGSGVGRLRIRNIGHCLPYVFSCSGLSSGSTAAPGWAGSSFSSWTSLPWQTRYENMHHANVCSHGLITIKTTNPKYCLYCVTVYRMEIQSVMFVFSTSFVNCCPSNLLSV